MIYASADYDGLELRTIAQSCLKIVGFSKLAEALNAGEDVHLSLAAMLLGITYEEAKERIADESPAPVGWTSEADGVKTYAKLIDDGRQAGKVGNFGFWGGLGVKKMVLYARKSYNVRLTLEKAGKVKAAWKSRWPESTPYLDIASAQAQSRQPIVHLFTNRLRGGCTFCSAANSKFQGLGADATGRALCEVQRASYTHMPCAACDGAANGCEWCRPCHGPGISALYGSRMVNYVHDEFILESPEAWGHEVSHELVRVMVRAAAPFLPDVPATAKPLLSRYWAKKAKQVWIDDPSAPGGTGKRLVPWGEKVAA